LLLAVLPAAGCSNQPGEPVPPHETFELASLRLGETRRLNIYLPPSYTASATPLPVLYMLDGGIAESFPQLTNCIDELIRAGAIAPCLLVGIENTRRPRDFTGPTEISKDRRVSSLVGESTAFRRFLAEELFPAVESRYRCTGSRAIVGESLAGLFVVETLLYAPALFERYLAISPSLWWNDHHLVRNAQELVAALPPEPRMFWFNSGNEDSIAPHCATLAAILRASAPPALIWNYVPRADLGHRQILRVTKAEAFRAALWRP
jgi:predicted alpha/beta superfamily hydrolase